MVNSSRYVLDSSGVIPCFVLEHTQVCTLRPRTLADLLSSPGLNVTGHCLSLGSDTHLFGLHQSVVKAVQAWSCVSKCLVKVMNLLKNLKSRRFLE